MPKDLCRINNLTTKKTPETVTIMMQQLKGKISQFRMFLVLVLMYKVLNNLAAVTSFYTTNQQV